MLCILPLFNKHWFRLTRVLLTYGSHRRLKENLEQFIWSCEVESIKKPGGDKHAAARKNLPSYEGGLNLIATMQ